MTEKKEKTEIFSNYYTEVSDKKDFTFVQLFSSCVGLIAIIISLLCWLIFNWKISLIILAIFIGLVLIGLCFLIPSSTPKEEYSQKIKSFIGLDFGDNFTMWSFLHREHDEFYLLFDDEDFEKVKKYCATEFSKVNQEKFGKYGFEVGENVYILPYVKYSPHEGYVHLHEEDRLGLTKLWRPEEDLSAGFLWHTLEIDIEDKSMRFLIDWF